MMALALVFLTGEGEGGGKKKDIRLSVNLTRRTLLSPHRTRSEI